MEQEQQYPIFSFSQESNFNDNLSDFSNNNNNNQTLIYSSSDTEPIYRDLLLPYVFSLSFIGRPHPKLRMWPLYNRGPDWSTRKDAIVWRGSTTGPGWEEGPRFQLIGDYGGTGVHPIAPNVSVDADFAFVKVVQNNGHVLDPNKYRRTKPMSYKDIQKYKYVLDIDGNGTFFLICCVDRTLTEKSQHLRNVFRICCSQAH